MVRQQREMILVFLSVASRWIAFALLSGVLHVTMAAAIAGSESTREQEELRELSAQQNQLLLQVKAQLAGLPDDPPPSSDESQYVRDRREKKAKLRELIGEVERRMNEQGKIYLSSGAKFTPEMRLYHDKLVRKIEDCGTSHLPKRDGKTVHGKGLVEMTIDKAGKVLDAEIVESSGERLVDWHMQRVVRSSSPFGPLPQRLTTESSLSFQSAVILVRFEFKNDDVPIESIPEKDRCRWK